MGVVVPDDLCADEAKFAGGAAVAHGSQTRRGPPEQESMQSIEIAVVAEGFGTGQMLLDADKKKLHGRQTRITSLQHGVVAQSECATLLVFKMPQ